MPNIVEITDFQAPELDVYARLTEVQLLNREYPEKGLFIAESPKVIERALNAGYQPADDHQHRECTMAGIRKLMVLTPEMPPSYPTTKQ